MLMMMMVMMISMMIKMTIHMMINIKNEKRMMMMNMMISCPAWTPCFSCFDFFILSVCLYFSHLFFWPEFKNMKNGKSKTTCFLLVFFNSGQKENSQIAKIEKHEHIEDTHDKSRGLGRARMMMMMMMMMMTMMMMNMKIK